MKNKNKVSVIVPIYGVDQFLDQCITSIMNQDYDNIEIILVDDGSLDNSPKICDKYAKKDKRIKVIHKENAGVSAARNSGLEIATGEFVCFVDGDDYVAEDYVSYLVNLATINKVDVAACLQMFTDFNTKQNKDKVKIVSGEDATEAILCYHLPIGVNAKIFRRKFLCNKLKFSEELVIGEGFNFNTMAFQLAKKVAIGYRKIYFYRKNNPSSVTTIYNEKKWNNGLYALEKIKNDFIIRTPKLMRAWKYANWRTHSDAYDLLIISKETNKYKDTYKKFQKIIRKGFYYSLFVPISGRDRLRAFVMMIFPKAIPWAMILRRRTHNIKF